MKTHTFTSIHIPTVELAWVEKVPIIHLVESGYTDINPSQEGIVFVISEVLMDNNHCVELRGGDDGVT